MSRTTTAIWVIFMGVGGATICRALSLAMLFLRPLAAGVRRRDASRFSGPDAAL